MPAESHCSLHSGQSSPCVKRLYVLLPKLIPELTINDYDLFFPSIRPGMKLGRYVRNKMRWTLFAYYILKIISSRCPGATLAVNIGCRCIGHNSHLNSSSSCLVAWQLEAISEGKCQFESMFKNHSCYVPTFMSALPDGTSPVASAGALPPDDVLSAEPSSAGDVTVTELSNT